MNRRSFFGWLTGAAATVALPVIASAKPDKLFIGTRRVVNRCPPMEPVFTRETTAYCEDWKGILTRIGPGVPRAEYRDIISGRVYTKPMTTAQLRDLTA